MGEGNEEREAMSASTGAPCGDAGDGQQGGGGGEVIGCYRGHRLGTWLVKEHSFCLWTYCLSVVVPGAGFIGIVLLSRCTTQFLKSPFFISLNNVETNSQMQSDLALNRLATL